MNMMTGHQFLKKNFGIVPKHAWHADAFGHSSSTVELFSRMGFETISFARIDDEEKIVRKNKKEMEFIWTPTFEGVKGYVPSNHSIFTHVMHELYNAPCGMDQWTGFVVEQ